MPWQVYLSGEIHTDWRERIVDGGAAAGLDVEFTGPVTDHGASDDGGAAILGAQSEQASGTTTWAPASTRSARARCSSAPTSSSCASASSTASGTRPSTPATPRRWARPS